VEALLTLLGLAVIIWIFAGPFLALSALRRAKRAEEDLLRLRRWVSRLDRGEHLLPREGSEQAPTTSDQAWSQEEAQATRPAATPPREPLPFRREEPEPSAAPEVAAAPDAEEDAASTESPPPIAPPPPLRQPTRESKPIEWERWVGVRGAALLGGVLFALAAIFLYMHAVEQQWITPRSRVFSGTGSGLLMLGVAEYLRRKRFQMAPGAVTAAGIVALYASTWAALELYALIGQAPALAAFAATTALCVGLAIRHNSQFVAILGLLGGFATPLVLQMPAGNPIGFFGYVLLLDAGILMVGRRKSWHSLGLIGLVATGALEVYWAAGHASPDEALLGLGLFAAIALLFIAGRPVLDRVEPAVAQLMRGLVVLTPMLLGVYFAQRADIQMELWVLATYATFLTIGGLVLARRQGNATISITTAVALVAVVYAWTGGRTQFGADALQLCAVSAGLIVLFTIIGRLEGTVIGRATALTVLSGSAILLAGIALPAHRDLQDAPWPWLGAAAVSLAALSMQRSIGWWRCLPSVATGTLAAITLYLRTHPDNAYAPSTTVVLGAAVAFALFTGVELVGARRKQITRCVSAALAIAPLLVLFAFRLVETPGPVYPAAMTALALCIAAIAANARSGVLFAGAVALAAFALPARWAATELAGLEVDQAGSWVLATICSATAVLIAWPAVFRARFAKSPTAWRAAALVGPLYYAIVVQVIEPHWGRSWKLLAPAFVAACLLAADTLGARLLDPELRSARDLPVRRTARTWMRGIAMPFVAAALVLWLDDSWSILWLAATGALLAFVARTERHPGPAIYGTISLAFSSLALLVAGGERWYETSEVFLFNRMTLDAWGAALCAGFALWCATRTDNALLELSRPWLQRVLKPLQVTLALTLALILFQWINLMVFDHWSTSTRVAIRYDHLPARDLTLSSSWIVYGLAWLGVGMWKRLSAARWLSLAILLLSLGKAFLFDLAHLEGLYRVASLLGLGLSLVAVSLLYQRFVFRERAA
jgi:uncharacterized membrane protein